ncbi:uncharacterized protein G2W53_026729 [Senna tora]|uniref:Uncharacterized protein n=1 Tax=Senna tora TaxID=362788 RepID=A0A834THQ3_9FABA|nr:uncharacterized protein G2W53_026729 [Senna tora]
MTLHEDRWKYRIGPQRGHKNELIVGLKAAIKAVMSPCPAPDTLTPGKGRTRLSLTHRSLFFCNGGVAVAKSKAQGNKKCELRIQASRGSSYNEDIPVHAPEFVDPYNGFNPASATPREQSARPSWNYFQVTASQMTMTELFKILCNKGLIIFLGIPLNLVCHSKITCWSYCIDMSPNTEGEYQGWLSKTIQEKKNLGKHNLELQEENSNVKEENVNLRKKVRYLKDKVKRIREEHQSQLEDLMVDVESLENQCLVLHPTLSEEYQAIEKTKRHKSVACPKFKRCL